MAVLLARKVADIDKPGFGTSQTETFVEFGIHSTKFELFLSPYEKSSVSQSFVDIFPLKSAADVKYRPFYGLTAHIIFLASNMP